MLQARPRKNVRYARESAAGVLLSIPLIILFGVATRSLIAIVGAFIVLLVIPSAGWTIITETCAGRFLQYFLVNRTHDHFLPKALQKRFLPSEYFRRTIAYPKKLWYRILQVLLFVFYLSSLTAPRFPLAMPVTPVSETGGFAIFGIIFLTILAPFLVLVWIYEDWGVRGYDSARAVAYPIGNTVIGYATGLGTLGTVARFLISISSNEIQTAGSIVAVLTILLPPCFFVTAFFHSEVEPRLLEKLSKSAIAKAIPLKGLKIE